MLFLQMFIAACVYAAFYALVPHAEEAGMGVGIAAFGIAWFFTQGYAVIFDQYFDPEMKALRAKRPKPPPFFSQRLPYALGRAVRLLRPRKRLRLSRDEFPKLSG